MGRILTGIVFAVILVTVGYQLVRKARESSRNDALPVLTTPLTVAATRTDTIAQSAQVNPKDQLDPSSRSLVAFRLPDGQTVELELNHEKFAALPPGQQGRLSYQGTRYLGLEKSP